MQGSGFRVQGPGFRVQEAWCRVQGSGCRVQGAGFRVQGSGCRVQGSGFRRLRGRSLSGSDCPTPDAPAKVLGFGFRNQGFRNQGSEFRVQGAGCRVQGSGFSVQGSESGVQGSGSRVQGSGFRVQGPGARGLREDGHCLDRVVGPPVHPQEVYGQFSLLLKRTEVPLLFRDIPPSTFVSVGSAKGNVRTPPKTKEKFTKEHDLRCRV